MTNAANIEQVNRGIQAIRQFAARLYEQAGRVLVGQDNAIELLVVALLARGHVLLEGVPGTAKTLMAKTLAQLVDAEFRRIQFTPDLMPSDIVGTVVFDINTSTFNLKRGPIFTQILLADRDQSRPGENPGCAARSDGRTPGQH